MKKCSVCINKNLYKINQGLIDNETYRSLSEKYGVTISALHRHHSNCLPKNVAIAMNQIKQDGINTDLAEKLKETQELRLSDSLDLAKKINFLIKETEDLYDIARADKQNLTALKALDSLRNTYSFCVQMLQQLENTYKAKLELAKVESGEKSETEKKQNDERLKSLTDPELEILERITLKMWYKNGDVIFRHDLITGELVIVPCVINLFAHN
ncbi:MAG: hypothetical protein ABR927_15715 [Bacteroidales bacterium]|jgi:hypothetical protein